MKIAITADVHLSFGSHPERENALEDILKKLPKLGVDQLFIAGDLFDKDFQNFSDFETLCSKSEYSSIMIHVIRGNHDKSLLSQNIVADNVRIYDKPELIKPDTQAPAFLMLPYEDVAMSEKLSLIKDRLEPEEWILIGHGDYIRGHKKLLNPYEKGVYMPFLSSDINTFRPLQVFLGHIHKKGNYDNKVHYPGSPCGLDINETGKRSFIIYDTNNNSVTEEKVDTDVIYYNETITVLPSENELEKAENDAKRIIETWDLDKDEKEKTSIRIRVQGYAEKKKDISETLKEILDGFNFHDGQGIDLNGLEVASDDKRKEIAQKTVSRIREMERPEGENEPSEDEIIMAALRVIYGS